jgi:hypothetical protein
MGILSLVADVAGTEQAVYSGGTQSSRVRIYRAATSTSSLTVEVRRRRKNRRSCVQWRYTEQQSTDLQSCNQYKLPHSGSEKEEKPNKLCTEWCTVHTITNVSIRDDQWNSQEIRSQSIKSSPSSPLCTLRDYPRSRGKRCLGQWIRHESVTAPHPTDTHTHSV